MKYTMMTPRGYVVGYVEAYSGEEAATEAEKQGEVVIDVMDDIIVVPEEEQPGHGYWELGDY